VDSTCHFAVVHETFCPQVLGRTGAFNVATGGWVPCAILVGCLAFTVSKDEVRDEIRKCQWLA
jgi:hypothetical protein